MVKGKDITIKNTEPNTLIELYENGTISKEQTVDSLNQFKKKELIESMLNKDYEEEGEEREEGEEEEGEEGEEGKEEDEKDKDKYNLDDLD